RRSARRRSARGRRARVGLIYRCGSDRRPWSYALARSPGVVGGCVATGADEVPDDGPAVVPAPGHRELGGLEVDDRDAGDPGAGAGSTTGMQVIGGRE